MRAYGVQLEMVQDVMQHLLVQIAFCESFFYSFHAFFNKSV